MVKSFMYHANSSDICNKYSKRFLHKNLVDGTATTGSAYEQNQSLSERGAFIPLTAFVLLLILCVALAGRVKAEDLPLSGTCGDNCVYSIDSDKNLTITALKAGDAGYNANKETNIKKDMFSQDVYDNAIFNNVTLNGDFDSIGDRAFRSKTMTRVDGNPQGEIRGEVVFNGNVKNISFLAFADNNLTSIVIPETVTTIGAYAFAGNKLEKFTIPDSVTTIGDHAFYLNNLTELIIPDSVTSVGNGVLLDSGLDNVICKGSNCEDVRQLLVESGYKGKFHTATEKQCDGNYYWSGSSCNNKSGGINCEENFKQIETWCNRIRYTPADAAKVLKDTDNEIVMTFKVNR